MYAYSVFVPNFLVPQLFQPFLPARSLGIPHLRHRPRSWFPVTDTAGADPLPVQRCAAVPRLYLGWPDWGTAVTSSATSRIRRIPRNRLRIVVVVLAVLLVAGAVFAVRHLFFAPTKITAYFPTATSIYPGDEVRISGVKVGTIESIERMARRQR